MLRNMAILCAAAPLLMNCTDTAGSEQALRDHGYSPAYVAGYHDGCASGKNAGGDYFTQSARDEAAYASGSDYRTGWDYGFVTCRDEEKRELAIATAIGTGIAMSSAHGADGIDARKALGNVDTSAMQAAGW